MKTLLRLLPSFGLCVASSIALSLLIVRSQAWAVVLAFSIFLAASFFLVKRLKEFKVAFFLVLLMGVVLRLLFFASLPVLSDDFWRFIWDGRVSISGSNPFLKLPTEWIGSASDSSTWQNLYAQLNSPDYYTVYPPLAQYVFATSAFLGGADSWLEVLVMRTLIISIELSGIYALYRTLPKLGIAASYSYWLLLSPVFIVESVGNLHFEGAMIGMLCWSLYFFARGKEYLSVGFFSLAVLTKLLPIIFIPVLWRFLGWKKSVLYTALMLTSIFIFSLPFLSWEVVSHFASSLDLYFRKFEFNASFYFLLREVYIRLEGYSMISVLGPVLALATLIFGLYWAWIKKWAVHRMAAPLFATVLLYFLLSTTVHPWYGITLIFLSSILGSWRLVLACSLFYFSYFFYQDNAYEHAVWWLLLEYTFIVGLIVWAWRKGDLRFANRPKNPHLV